MNASKGTVVRYTRSRDRFVPYWDVSSDEAEKSANIMEFSKPPKFPEIPSHVIRFLKEQDYPKPYVREEDRNY
jgi:hypothetical protein